MSLTQSSEDSFLFDTKTNPNSTPFLLNSTNSLNTPSFLSKTPFLSKLLSNPIRSETAKLKSAKILCDEPPSSLLCFTQDSDLLGKDLNERKLSTDRLEHVVVEKKQENKIFVSLSIYKDKVGMGVLDVNSGKLYLSSFFLEPLEYYSLNRMLFQMETTLIITHSKIPLDILNYLKTLDFQIEVIPYQDFSVDSYQNLLENSHIQFSCDGSHSLKSNLIRTVPFESNNELTKAVGGLFSYYNTFLTNDSELNNIPINQIEQLNWNETFEIDENVLSSLYIFKKEQHPDVHSNGSSKEGISLFGCLNKCVTKGGSKLLRNWMFRIKLDKYCIEERQSFQKQFLNMRRNTLLDSLRKLLRKTNDFPTLCSKLLSFKMKDTDWIKLYTSISFIYQIITTLEETNVQHRVLTIIENKKKLIQSTKECLENVFDISLIEQKQIEFNIGYNKDYDNLIEKQKLLNKELNTLLQNENKLYIFIAEYGYMFETNESENVILKIKTKSYTKNEKCHQLDEEYGNITQKIMDTKISILDNLTTLLNKQNSDFVLLSQTLAEFDVLLSFVFCDVIFKWNIPIIKASTDNLILKEARNPITELVNDNFVSNDTTMSEIPIHIITGPNCSGKSVYLRQVGINVFMGLLGCGIAASYGEIPMFSRIATRITTQESNQNCLSAFAIDCSQLSCGLKRIDNTCLLIIDEFGKGTHPSDGYALFVALIKYIQSLGEKTPKTIIATHFINIFEEIECVKYIPMKMEVIVDNDNEGIKFLYHLKPGITDSSYGIHCAKSVGLSDRMIERSKQISNCLQNNISILPQSSALDVEKYYNYILNKFYGFNEEKDDLNELIDSMRQISNKLQKMRLKP